MREWFVRFADWLRRDRLERELDDELRFHQAQLERDAAVGGTSSGEAADAARRRLGNITRVKEDARERWSVPSLDVLLQDTRYALRGLRRNPGFTVTVALMLALGIGANAVMFGVVDQLMFRPLGRLRDPGTVHRIYVQSLNPDGRPFTSPWFSAARYNDLRRWTSSFSQAAAFNERNVAIGLGEGARERRVGLVSASFFDFFDAPPALGRYFTAPEDVMPQGTPVAVLSHALWQSDFGRRNVIGEALQVGAMRATIIGVAAEGLVGVNDANPPVVFVPISTLAAVSGGTMPASLYEGYGMLWAGMLTRRQVGVSAEAASVDATNALRRSWEAERAADPRPAVGRVDEAQPRAIVSAVRLGAGPDPSLEARTARWLAAVAGMVLLIACANVANLQVARMLRRQRETAVRQSLGAGRGRLLGQAAIESFLLAGIGAAGAVVVAQVGGAAIQRLLIVNATISASSLGDPRQLIVIAVLAIVVGIVTGVAPLAFGTRTDLTASLRAGARGGVTQRPRLRAALLVAQAALSVTLLVGAGFFVRSLQGVKAMRMGYDADRVLLVRRVMRGVQLDAPARTALRNTLLLTAQSLPGVEHASWITSIPLGLDASLRFSVPGVDSVGRLGQFSAQEATPEYFRVMGTRILRGRAFSPDDRFGAPNVAVVSESMAKAVWPGRDAIGQCIRIGADTMPCTTVVGVAEDMVQNSVTATQRFHVYMPIDQRPSNPGTGMLLRLRGDPAVDGERIRATLQRVMPGASYLTVQPMRELVDVTRRPWRLGATMFVAFGVLALVVAGVGLYGLVGYNVTTRMHELSVRVALGARRSDILGLVVGQSMRLMAVGVLLGTAIALGAGRWLEPLLFRQSMKDPTVYGFVAVLLMTVALIASSAPARRAAAADPNAVLRSE